MKRALFKKFTTQFCLCLDLEIGKENRMKSEDYRSYLVECVKTLGQMIKDNAEDIVGETDHISGLTLSADFDQEFYGSIPELTITRSHLPDKEKIDRLMDIRSGKEKRDVI